MSHPLKRRNYVRRGIGILLLIAPVLLAIASVIYGAAHGDLRLLTGRHRVPDRLLIGGAFIVGACFFAVVNFHLSYVRPLLYKLRKGSLEGYKFDSGIPILGTICVTIGTLLAFGSIAGAGVALLSICLDTGGWPWALVCTWKDASLWDE